MVGYVLTLPNRAFAVPKASGDYHIKNVPAGKHKVFACHPVAKAEKAEVKVEALQTATAHWSLSLTKQVQPHHNKKGRPYKKQRKKY